MFKKIIFGLMALMCLTACDEDYTDWKAPQGNPQKEAQNIMLNITPCADIDMSVVTADSIELAQYTIEQPEGFVTDSFALDVVGNDGSLTPLDVNDEGKVATADVANIVT